MLKGILVISLQGGFLLFSKRYARNFGLQPPNGDAKYDSHTLGSLLYTLCCYGDGSVVADANGVVEGTGNTADDGPSDSRAPRGTALRRLDFGDVCVSVWTPEMKAETSKFGVGEGPKRNVLVAVISSSSWVRNPWELAAFLGQSFCSQCSSALDETESVIGSPRPSAGLKRFKTAVPKVLKGFAGMMVQRVLLSNEISRVALPAINVGDEEQKDQQGALHELWTFVFYLGEELEQRVGTRELFSRPPPSAKSSGAASKEGTEV